MTLYAGENVIVTHTVTLEGTALTGPEVTSVTIEIFNSDAVEVVGNTAMTWDATDLRWEYEWDTTFPTATPTPLTAGTYRARVTVEDLTGKKNWEYKRIRLATNPVTFP